MSYKKIYCVDCGKLLNAWACWSNTIRCRSCTIKKLFKNPKNHPMYGKKGRLNPKWKEKNHTPIHCVNCGKLLHDRAYYYKTKICKSCARKEQFKYKIKYYCIDCKTQITRHGIRCQPCAMKKRYKNMENHPRWCGGKSSEEYGPEFDSALKEQVRLRDKYKCRECGCTQLENGKQLDVHHIDYDKKNNIITNLISLCKKCHTKTNSNRKYWTEYFINIIKKIYQKVMA